MRASPTPAVPSRTRAPSNTPPPSLRRHRGACVFMLLLAGGPFVGARAALGAPPESASEHGWIRQWTDVRGDLRGADVRERVRAIERLGASRETRSRSALVDAVKAAASDASGEPRPSDENATQEDTAPVDASPAERAKVRLALARALAQHAEDLDARRALVRLMTSAADGAEPRDEMALHTAALALARSGTPDALQALARALWQGPSLAAAAHGALLAHPPGRLDPLLDGAPVDASTELLAELGDPRAYDHLGELVREAPPARAASAAWALYRLGTPETLELARYWWRKSTDTAHRSTAVRILVESGDPLGASAMADLLADLPRSRSQRLALLELAAEHPDPAWEAALLRLARAPLSAGPATLPSVEDEAILLALAKLDRPASLRHLLRGLDGPNAHVVAGALARTDGSRASALLGQALEQPTQRRWALRALAVRLARGTAQNQGAALVRTATNLLREARPDSPGVDAADRAAAAWALAVARPERAAALLSEADPVVLRALGRQSFAGPLAKAAARKLSRRTPSEEGDVPGAELALYPSLLAPAAASNLPTRHLAALLSRADAAAPAVIEVLASRTTRRVGLIAERGSEDPLREVRGWLESTSAPTRAAAARGLGAAGPSAAVALLEKVLLWDPEPSVRGAAAWALSRRPESARRRVLELAAELDPSPLVRALAGANAGVTESKEAGPALLWLHAEQPVQLFSARGEALLLFPDPDGFVGVQGAMAEPWELRRLPVANPSPRGEAPPRR